MAKTRSKKKAASGKRAAVKAKAKIKKKFTLRGKSTRTKKRAPARRPAAVTRVAAREPSSGSERSSLGSGFLGRASRPTGRGLGEEAGGQSGDLQGLSREEDANVESVEELVEEGQAYEADVINGVENAPDADEGPVRTHERPEDDIPPEERSDEV
jgi:hypothetical protein